MPLGAGARLGPYEIVSLAGSGGMGEVYKARDTRLDRTVAIKILPAMLALDPQFRDRFEREARAISALEHPHICPLYDVGEQDGTFFLVLQYLEGETLAERIAKGPVPLDEALGIASDIASALDRAHRAGIVHRDLKPGNVLLTKSGAMLLDFGLAKTKAPAVVGSGMTALATTPPSITVQGTILGTFQYMSPEQIEGVDADARTDIFAFGCVLYEMLTGRKAFDGKTRASLLGAILKDDPPPVSQVQPLAAPALDRIVRTCLEKDPDDRWQSARDLFRELKWAAESPPAAPSVASTSVVVQPAGRRAVVPWIAAAALAAGLAGVLVLWAPWRTVEPAATLRLSGEIGAGASLASTVPDPSALSPDGMLLVFVAQKSTGSTSQLFVRRLEQLQAIPMSGTDGAFAPFFSPDGRWIAFFGDGKLKKISVTGGAAVTLCDAPNGRGGSWAHDGTIVFTPDNTPNTSLQRVSAAGGKPEPLLKLADGEITQRWPQVLPGGKAVLFSANNSLTGWDEGNLVIQPLPAGARKVVQRGGYHGRYLPSGGHLVYIREGTLFAVPFDLDRLETAGQAVPALEGVSGNTTTGGAVFAFSENGTLVYLPGQSLGNDAPIHWLDREGKATPLRATPANWSNLHFAPDGRRLALEIFDGRQNDVWVYDWARDTLSRLTFDAGDDNKPVWTPDGRRIVFASRRADKSTFNLYWQRADGSTAEPQRLTESKNLQFPASWHPGGKVLAFQEVNPQTGFDLMMLPMEGDESSGWKPGKPTAFLTTPAVEGEPMFSPDGRWLAYQSTEAGRVEVYVRPFPGPGGKWQISTGGGVSPTWSRTRPELFYGTLDQRIMFASYVIEGDSFRADKPQPWAEGRYTVRPRQRAFDLHPDGQRFALTMIPEAQAGAKQDKVVFIFNFFDELRRVAPHK